MKLLMPGAAALPAALLCLLVAPTEGCAPSSPEAAETSESVDSASTPEPAGSAPDPAEDLASEITLAALDRALLYVEKDGLDWMAGRVPVQEGSGCVSCHHVGFALWGHREALRAGLPVPDERVAAMDELEATAREFIATPERGRPVSWGQLLLGRHDPEQNSDAARTWRSFHGHIADALGPAGFWKARGQFPFQNRPRQETDDIATLWTLLALEGSLGALAPPEESDDGDAADPSLAQRRRALEYLAGAERGQSHEWLAAKLLVERADGSPERAARLLEELLALQHEDGGWSWLPEDPSNAYSTGQGLYALALAGLPPDHPAIQAGVQYLLETQAEDGSWFVPSRLTSAQESHERDYIYTYWGTAWAVIGLSRTLPSEAAETT